MMRFHGTREQIIAQARKSFPSQNDDIGALVEALKFLQKLNDKQVQIIRETREMLTQ